MTTQAHDATIITGTEIHGDIISRVPGVSNVAPSNNTITNIITPIILIYILMTLFLCT